MKIMLFLGGQNLRPEVETGHLNAYGFAITLLPSSASNPRTG